MQMAISFLSLFIGVYCKGGLCFFSHLLGFLFQHGLRILFYFMSYNPFLLLSVMLLKSSCIRLLRPLPRLIATCSAYPPPPPPPWTISNQTPEIISLHLQIFLHVSRRQEFCFKI